MNITSTSPNDSPQDEDLGTSTLPDLIKCVANLRVTIAKLQKEVQEVNTKYDQLSESVRKMKTDVTTDHAAPKLGECSTSVNEVLREISPRSSKSPASSPSDSELSTDDYQYQRKEKQKRRR